MVGRTLNGALPTKQLGLHLGQVFACFDQHQGFTADDHRCGALTRDAWGLLCQLGRNARLGGGDFFCTGLHPLQARAAGHLNQGVRWKHVILYLGQTRLSRRRWGSAWHHDGAGSRNRSRCGSRCGRRGRVNNRTCGCGRWCGLVNRHGSQGSASRCNACDLYGGRVRGRSKSVNSTFAIGVGCVYTAFGALRPVATGATLATVTVAAAALCALTTLSAVKRLGTTVLLGTTFAGGGLWHIGHQLRFFQHFSARTFLTTGATAVAALWACFASCVRTHFTTGFTTCIRTLIAFKALGSRALCAFWTIAPFTALAAWVARCACFGGCGVGAAFLHRTCGTLGGTGQSGVTGFAFRALATALTGRATALVTGTIGATHIGTAFYSVGAVGTITPAFATVFITSAFAALTATAIAWATSVGTTTIATAITALTRFSIAGVALGLGRLKRFFLALRLQTQ